MDLSPPPSDPAALSVDIGLGPRLVPGLVDGNQWSAAVSGRLLYRSRWGLDLGGALRLPPLSQELPALAELALTRAERAYVDSFQWPIEREIATFHLQAELAAWSRPPDGGLFLALTVGGEVKLVRTDVATALDELSVGELSTQVGPALGVEAEYGFARRFAVRGSWVERVWFPVRRSYQPGLDRARDVVLSPSFLIDLRVRL